MTTSLPSKIRQQDMKLDSTQLTANNDEICADYDPTAPIEKYIARVEKCMDIAANRGAPFSLQQILTITFDAMYRTGLYNKKCLTWEDKPDTEKMWPNWKIFSPRSSAITGDSEKQQECTIKQIVYCKKISNKT
eukprot:4991502-Ditylum_brightwellii.AAC.1